MVGVSRKTVSIAVVITKEIDEQNKISNRVRVRYLLSELKYFICFPVRSLELG